MTTEQTSADRARAVQSSDYDQLKQFCVLVEESQHRRLLLTESITAANFRFIETGCISQMAEIIAESCMKVTGSTFSMVTELLSSGNAAVIALCTSPDVTESSMNACRDIQYEIRRHGSFELQHHQSPLFIPLESGAL